MPHCYGNSCAINGITQCYLPSDRGDIATFITHAHARTHVTHAHTHTHTHTHNRLWPSWILSRTTWVSRHQKGKTSLDLLEQEHQLGHMQISTFIQTYNHASIPPLSFLQAGCHSYLTTSSIKALKVFPPLSQPVKAYMVLDLALKDMPDADTPFVWDFIQVSRYQKHTQRQPFYGPLGFCPGLPGWASTRKVKPGK